MCFPCDSNSTQPRQCPPWEPLCINDVCRQCDVDSMENQCPPTKSLCIDYTCTQDFSCDTSNQEEQCLSGELCINNKCTQATTCDSSPDCPGTTCTMFGSCTSSGPQGYCRSGYCQRETCRTTGQCVNGQGCSVIQGSCTYLRKYSAEEGKTFTLNIIDPEALTSKSEIRWFKGVPKKPIASYLPSFWDLGPQPSYSGEYCPNPEVHWICETSQRGSLDKATGALTIYSLDHADSDYYYYTLTPRADKQYELHLEVYIQPQEPQVTNHITPLGNPELDQDKEVKWICSVDHIRPVAMDIYWMLNGTRINGTVVNNDPDPNDMSFNQTNILIHSFTEDDEGLSLECIVIPKYGKRVSAKSTIDLWKDEFPTEPTVGATTTSPTKDETEPTDGRVTQTEPTVFPTNGTEPTDGATKTGPPDGPIVTVLIETLLLLWLGNLL